MKSISFCTVSLAFISTLILSSCNYKTAAIAQKESLPQTLSYLALGDSYTIGESVATKDRWPNQLAAIVTSAEMKMNPVNIIAQTGWTTNDLLKAIEKQKPIPHDIVSLLIGVNNQYQGLSFDDFEREFKELMSISKSLSTRAEKGVFVVSIPDYGLTPFVKNDQERIATELDKYNAFMKTVCIEEGIPFIDITTVSRELGAAQDAIAEDGLHPSGFQYEKWANEMTPVVKNLITE